MSVTCATDVMDSRGRSASLKGHDVIPPGTQGLNRRCVTEILAYPEYGAVEGERTIRDRRPTVRCG